MSTRLGRWRSAQWQHYEEGQHSDPFRSGQDRGRPFVHDLAAAVPAWLTARVLVLAALAASHPLQSRYRPLESSARRVREGLLAWDGDWFHDIAQQGYAALPRPGLRYFPLFPMLGKGLSVVLFSNVGLSLILLANLFSLLAGAALHRLVLQERGDERLARRAVWVLALAPPSFVLVMGYTEPLAILLAVATFMALRRRRWGWAAAGGYLSGLARPLGVLLSIPAAVEALWQLRQGPARQRLGALASVVAPVAGCLTYLAWVGVRFGDPLLPYSSQQTPEFRGGFANPLVTLVKTAAELMTGRLATKNVPHLPWALVLIALVVLVCRRWPPSYGAFAVATLMVALSTERLGSLERYGFACFPVLLGAATMAKSDGVHRVVVVVSGGLMTMYATLTFMGLYIP
ncbi:MAG TPA: mannosyltransferase family protein [Acidimicrobiales bacterium]|nr:mannosyltransferase family protein [Acidimicrobiales bacterium]